MRVKTSVKAGGRRLNENQTMASGVRVKTSVKAGGRRLNENQTMAPGAAVKKVQKTLASTRAPK